MLNALWPICSWATGDIRMMRWIMLRLDQLAPTMGVEGWIIMGSGAFLISLCFLVSFIAADAWMSRQPMSLRSICSNVLELYESRGEITYNDKWQQELRRLRDDYVIALSKYDPTSTKYNLTGPK